MYMLIVQLFEVLLCTPACGAALLARQLQCSAQFCEF